jgi:hypothetical protein
MINVKRDTKTAIESASGDPYDRKAKQQIHKLEEAK